MVNFVVRRAFDEQVQASGGVLRGVRVPEMVRHKALIGLRWVHLEMQGGGNLTIRMPIWICDFFFVTETFPVASKEKADFFCFICKEGTVPHPNPTP